MTSTEIPAATRTPQAERTAATRLRLMEATVDCLVELGWAGTTTTIVSERAGVSRGAQLHHFPTKQDLVVSAVAYLISSFMVSLSLVSSIKWASRLIVSLGGPVWASAQEKRIRQNAGTVNLKR